MDDDRARALLILADVYGAATNRSRPRIATLCANDGKFFKRVEAGGSFYHSTYVSILRWFEAHWPAGLEWPAGVERPSLLQPRAAA